MVGTGLIGASAALAARRAGVARRARLGPGSGAPRDRRRARARSSRRPTSASAVATRSSCSSRRRSATLPRTVREVLDRAPGGSTVTDVGSTKRPVCAAAGGDPRFVGGHPICGAETRGPERATAELFDGATWFLTPTAATSPERLRLVHGFVSALGARPVAIGPDAARPARRGDEPSAARARERPPQPGGLDADRRPRPARRPRAARCAT